MLYTKTCGCGTVFTSTGPAAKYCEVCAERAREAQKQKARERAEARRRREGRRVGRGALPAEQHPNYKHGFYVAQTQCRKYKDKVQNCERCGEDLTAATKWHWCVHHKDHNHSNHSEDNLELLCKRCHQIEHECWNNFDK